jgi:ABC-type branched-subunit amino acid transport system ATPase component
MHIEYASVINYKSFLSQTDIVFKSGLNVIIGRNDVGKTALTEALSTNFVDKPHLSSATVPTIARSPSDQESRVDLTLSLSRDEVLELLKPSFLIYVPVINRANIDGEMQRFELAFSNTPHKITFRFRPRIPKNATFAAFDGPLPTTPNIHNFGLFHINPDGQLTRQSGTYSVHIQQSFPSNLTAPLLDRIFAFRAERMNIGESEAGPSMDLKPDASNLAQVLNVLQSSNPSAWERYNRLVSIVFPHIRQVTAPPVGSGRVGIKVWSIEPQSERTDLAIPLSESGTGISQVLAILYVALTANYPRVIIIDEPQSFLHPGAVRKLLDVLKEFKEHQYIVSTHSPMVISSAEPESTLVVRKENSESTIEHINATERQELEMIFSEVGARLSDVFGADHILWVEGRTEEECFPLILSKHPAPHPIWGVKILGVVSTGGLEGKHSRTIIDIYRRLSRANGIIPPALGFILDREGRNDSQLDDIRRESNGAVHFLPRRTYENYLLDPRALSVVMSNIPDFSDSPITEAEVRGWIDHRRTDDENWEANVNGAKILSDLFSDLSDARCTYEKVKHGTTLTREILSSKPLAFKEVSDLLHEILQDRTGDS